MNFKCNDVIILSLFLTLLVLSCQKKDLNKIENTNINNSKKLFSEYLKTNNKDFLEKSYFSLNKDKEFQKNGIASANLSFVISLYLYVNKYKELSNLLVKFKTNDEKLNFLKSYNYNFANYLMYYPEDSIKAINFINNNINLINLELKNNPKDSLLYLGYFYSLYLKNLNNKEFVLDKIDSMQLVNKNFSSLFYNIYLKQSINEYPKELLPKNIFFIENNKKENLNFIRMSPVPK